MENTKTGGLHWGKVPSGLRFRLSSPRSDHVFGFDAEPARWRPKRPKMVQNGSKRAAEGAAALTLGCCSAPTACHALPMRHEAARARTEDPRRGLGLFLACSAPFWPHFGEGLAPHLRGPPRGPAEGGCNLARGLAHCSLPKSVL